MKNIIALAALLVALTCFFISCTNEQNNYVKPIPSTLNLPATPFNYIDGDYQKAAGFTFQDPAFGNSTTNEGATLGRVLFYDTRLSLNSSVSCATCHIQQKAFAHSTPFSVGFEGRITKRNSPPVMNILLSQTFFWDSSLSNLEDMVLMPIKNHLEMGIDDLGHLQEKLKSVDYYPPLFKEAFGSEEVTAERISMALAQFVRSMVSVNSKFDDVVINKSKEFTSLENLGFQLFNSARLSCSSCHGSFNFTSWGGDAANIGLDMDYEDEGVSDGRFKIPSLRNIALTAPYMHDGRFATLEQVIAHYSEGIKANPALDFRLREGYPDFLGIENPVILGGPVFTDPISGRPFINGQFIDNNDFDNRPPKRPNLNDIEKQAIVAFLKTLTDPKFLTDKKFSNPFVH